MKRKREGKISAIKKQKGNKIETYAPWWSQRIFDLSKVFNVVSPISATKSHLSWIPATNHTHDHCKYGSKFDGVANCTCRDVKQVQTTTKRSKKELAEDELLRCRRVRINPTKEQKQLFHRWYGITSFAYNEVLRLVTEEGWKSDFKLLKEYLLNKTKNKHADKYPFLFDKKLCHSDVKAEAAYDLYSAIATTKKSLEAKGLNPNRFEMKKRTKKDTCQRFYVLDNGGRPSVKWTNQGFTFWSRKRVGIIKPYNKKELTNLPSSGECKYKVTIKYESPGRYYMLIPIVLKEKTQNTDNVVAFDPGVRTFQTGFTNQGHFVEYGKDAIGRLFFLAKKMDVLQSKIDKNHKSIYESTK